MAEVALLAGDNENTSIEIEGYHAKEDEDMNVEQNKIGPGFFATLGMPLLAGRDFTNGDGPKAPLAVIVNERFAKSGFPKDGAAGLPTESSAQNATVVSPSRVTGFAEMNGLDP